MKRAVSFVLWVELGLNAAAVGCAERALDLFGRGLRWAESNSGSSVGGVSDSDFAL